MTPSDTITAADVRDRIYRITIAGNLSSSFRDAFPQLAPTPGDGGNLMVLEGVVADPAQLAGIVSAICHRNTPVLHLEIVDTASTR